MKRLKELQYDIYPKLPYWQFIHDVAHHIEEKIEEIDGIPYLLTVTFAPARTPDLDTRGKITPRSARSILNSFEYCYGCLMRSKKLLGNSYERKRHLQPLTYAFADFSYTKGPSCAGFSDRPQGSRVDEREPGANAHLHCIMVVHPHTRENLEHLGSRGLEEFFKSRCTDVATVDLREIDNLYSCLAVDPQSRITRAIAADRPFDPATEYLNQDGALPYASKALERERDEHARDDLFTILPDSGFRPPSRVERLEWTRFGRRRWKGHHGPEVTRTPILQPAANPLRSRRASLRKTIARVPWS